MIATASSALAFLTSAAWACARNALITEHLGHGRRAIRLSDNKAPSRPTLDAGEITDKGYINHGSSSTEAIWWSGCTPTSRTTRSSKPAPSID